MTTVEVHLDRPDDTVHVGTARFTEHTRGGRQPMSFEYVATYLADPRAYPLDPGLPLTTGLQYRGDGLFGAFADSAPDRWGRRLIDRSGAETSLRFRGDAEYLLAVDDTLRHGALRFRAPDGNWLATGSRIPPLIDLPALADSARAADADPHASVKSLLDAGSATLGGARPKATVRDGDELWLAKFSRVRDLDEWNVIGLEKTALDLARRFGLDVPPARLVGSTLLVRRFDRDPARVGYLSAMSLLDRRDGDTADYLDLAIELDGVSAAPDRDLRELWRRIAFSVAIHNTDDHLRNHGFLRHRHGWRLSPLFDVNPNPIVDEQRATSIAGAAGPDSEFAALIDNAPYFRLTTDDAAAQLHELGRVVADWTAVAARNGVSGRDIGLMADALDRAASALPAS